MAYCARSGGHSACYYGLSRLLLTCAGFDNMMVERQNPNLNDLYKNSLLAEKKGRPFLMAEKIDGLNCSQLSNGYWVNVNYSIPRLMEIIAAFDLHASP